MTNEQLVEKAVITTTALATAGKLSPLQSDRFIDFIIDLTQLRNNVRVVRFSRETMQIDKIGVGNRVTVPKAEASAPQVRRGVSLTKVELTPKDQMTPFEISDNFPDQCIEGERVEDTVTRLMATQTGNDLEELCINGDTLGHARLESEMIDNGSTTQYVKDTFIAQFNGWMRLADSGNIYNALGSDIGSVIFSRMINTMPIKFRRVRRDVRFLSSYDHEQLYREKVGSRATPAGDTASQSSAPLTPYGIPLIAVPLLESTPRVVEHITIGAHPASVTLRYQPIVSGSVVITPTTINKSPITAYIETTDYTVNYTTGVISTTAAGAVASGTFKVTYQSYGQMLMTNYQNLILAIGRDITIEKDRDIYAGINQFAITTRLSVNVEEVTAIVKGINIGLN